VGARAVAHAVRIRLFAAGAAAFGLLLAWFGARAVSLPHDPEYQGSLFLMWPRPQLGGTVVQFALLSLDIVVPLTVALLFTAALLPSRLLAPPPTVVRVGYRYALVLPLFGFVATSLARVVSNGIYALANVAPWDVTPYIARLEAPLIISLQRAVESRGLSYGAAVVYAGVWMLALLVVPCVFAILGRPAAVGRLVTGWILAACLAAPIFVLVPVFEPWTLNSTYGYAGLESTGVRFLATTAVDAELSRILREVRWSAGACVPSLHVALPLVVSRIGFQQRMPAIGWLFAVFAVLVSFSIVYLGRHWLIDVVAGLAFGYGVARLVAWIRPERFLLLNSLPCADRGMT
jgi:hypothetical protein